MQQPYLLLCLLTGQGSITVPGCLAATPIEAPITIEEGYPTAAPLVYYFGDTTPNKQDELYRVSRYFTMLALHVTGSIILPQSSQCHWAVRLLSAALVVQWSSVGFELARIKCTSWLSR